MNYFLFALLLLTVRNSHAQEEPVIFEPGVISNGGVFGLTISPDSKTALWVKSNGKRDTLKIMESQKKGSKWTTPVVASFSTADGKWKDIDPIFSPDGKTLLFQSDRRVDGMPDRKGFDIWAVKKEKNGWSTAYHLGNIINSDSSESYASMSNNGNIYFMKNKDGNSDIYMSANIDGRYQIPQNIGAPINTLDRESNPFISPDEDYIIYFSSAPGGYGETDLYISFKNGNGWSAPRNLGKPVNSKLSEFCPFVHAKEKRLYYSKQSKKGDKTTEDIYSVPFDVQHYKQDK